MGYSSDNLIFRPRLEEGGVGVVNRVTAGDAGWELLNCEIRRLTAGETWTHETGDCEVAMVLLGGTCSVRSNRGTWERLGGRRDVFDGVADSLYLPAGSDFALTAGAEGLELAWAWVATDQNNEARRVAPSDCRIELRGGHNATRQINHIIPPGFDCHRIVACEVYTPGGNWSSYPPTSTTSTAKTPRGPSSRRTSKRSISTRSRDRGATPSSASTPTTGASTRPSWPTTTTSCWCPRATTR